MLLREDAGPEAVLELVEGGPDRAADGGRPEGAAEEIKVAVDVLGYCQFSSARWEGAMGIRTLRGSSSSAVMASWLGSVASLA